MIFVSDIHLSIRPPIARSNEPDWFMAMERSLKQVKQIAKDNPIICSGDIFDKWNPPPELINFAIKHLPKMYAVPGQHDLPYHNYADMHKSAFWTLVEAGNVVLIPPDQPLILNSFFQLHGFPWGSPLKPLEKKNTFLYDIAVIHHYVWKDGSGFHGAAESSHVRELRKVLNGYDLAVFGDNHKPFISKKKHYDNCVFLNCGSLMRRTIEQIDYVPSVWALNKDHQLEKYPLDISSDVMIESEQKEKNYGEIQEFVKNLSSIEASSFDFQQAIKEYFLTNPTKKEVKSIIQSMIEGSL